jgi:hypothetical protein
MNWGSPKDISLLCEKPNILAKHSVGAEEARRLTMLRHHAAKPANPVCNLGFFMGSITR